MVDHHLHSFQPMFIPKWFLSKIYCHPLVLENSLLVGGFTNPIEKYIVKMGLFPNFRGEHLKKIYETHHLDEDQAAVVSLEFSFLGFLGISLGGSFLGILCPRNVDRELFCHGRLYPAFLVFWASKKQQRGDSKPKISAFRTTEGPKQGK